LTPIVLWGVAGLLQKICTLDISGELSTLWFLGAFPLGSALLFADPVLELLPLETWALVACLGLFFGLGNLALLMAFASGGKASVIVPLTGLYPVVSVPLAILFLGERPGAREWAGIGLALASVVALSWERRAASHGQEAVPPPALPA
jgi:transporter family protein